MDRATRIDIITVRDPDFANEYRIFINGEDRSEETGAYAMNVEYRPDVRVEIWTFDFGADDLSDPINWTEDEGPWWTSGVKDLGSSRAINDLKVPPAVISAMEDVIERAREKYL